MFTMYIFLHRVSRTDYSSMEHCLQKIQIRKIDDGEFGESEISAIKSLTLSHAKGEQTS